MNPSILQNPEHCITFLEEAVEIFFKQPDQLADFVEAIRTAYSQLALFFLQDILESCDQEINDSGKRKQGCEVVNHTKRTLLTSLGAVSYPHTRFRDRKTGETCCLLDRLLGLSPHERLTGDATARILDEAVRTSYQKAGEAACPPDPVTRQAVRGHLQDLKFPPLPPHPGEKRAVETLYLDADEDHIALQYQEKKGDLVVNEHNQKNNGLMIKLIYVYEGIEPDPSSKGRYRLIRPYYFGGLYEGAEANRRLWDEVYQYLDQTYDLDQVKRISLNGDGADWIKAGTKQIAGMTFVLDGFHLAKYVNKTLAHSGDQKQERKEELQQLLKEGDRAKVRDWCRKRLAEVPQGGGGIQKGMDYLWNQWEGIQERLHGEAVVGCSAEGHVSHILSKRMSSRPMGWSRKGANAMAKLLIYVKNGGDLWELVKYQKTKEGKKPEEPEVLSCQAILSSEHKMANPLGATWEKMQVTVSLGTKKRVYFQNGIWNL